MRFSAGRFCSGNPRHTCSGGVAFGADQAALAVEIAVAFQMRFSGYAPEIDPQDTEDIHMVVLAPARREGLAVEYIAHQKPRTRPNGHRMPAL